MTKKKIQRNRMITYFIDAAAQIIEREGIHAITIRKVADLSGYNSATLYNYFENLDHLVFLAAMKFIKPYTENVSHYAKNAKDSLDKNLLVWECFCHYSFKNPTIYYAIFFAKLSSPIHDYIKEYYEIYPENLNSNQNNISTMLSKQNIYDRALVLLEDCVQEGFIDFSHINEVNEMTMMVYKGMLARVMNEEIDDSIENIVKRTIKYIKICYNAYLKNHHQIEL